MKIVLSFDSFEEFQEQINSYARRLCGKSDLVPIEDVTAAIKAEDLNKSAQKTAEKKAAEKKAEPAAEETPAPEPAEAPAEVDESYRTEVRRVLYEYNKKTGKKTSATDLIQQFGVNSLSKVALSDLPALMQMAQEALNA